VEFPPPSEEGKEKIPSMHKFPGSLEDRNEALLKRAREAYEAGTLDEDYLLIALEYGITPHEAYSAAFGYLPFVGGKAA
jgi:hypothetical protein